MVADIVILALIVGYGGWVIYHRKKHGGGCAGCSGGCAGCNGNCGCTDHGKTAGK